MATSKNSNARDELAHYDGDEIRSPLLLSLVDLYVQKPLHTPEEERTFTELAMRLLDAADTATRLATARRLQVYPATPAEIRNRLTAEWPALAEHDAARNVSGNSTTAPAIAREPLSAAELTELFFSAEPDERRMIMVNLTYGLPGMHNADALWEAGSAERQLETAALARNPDAFMRGLEQWLRISPPLAQRVVYDPHGEPIVVAAKALEISPAALQRILLFLNPIIGRSVQLVYELAALFDAIDVEAARAIVTTWRSAQPRPSTALQRQPNRSEDASRSRRSPGATAADLGPDAAPVPGQAAGQTR